MGFFSFGRIVGAFFNQLFRWLFWNKTGQKILFVIVIAFILVAFVKLGEVAAVEPDNFGTYEEISFDGPKPGFVASNGKISAQSSNQIYYYVELNPYNYYALLFKDTSGTNNIRFGFTNSLDVGTSLINYTATTISQDETWDYSFDGSVGYKYFIFYCNNINFVPSLYFNAFPYEVTPVSSYLTMYGSQLKWIVEPSNSDYQYNTWYFPVKAGNSYRLLYQGDTFSYKMSVGFLSSLDTITPYTSPSIINQYNYSYEFNVFLPSFTFTGSDFVAPGDGWIVVPGYKAVSSPYSPSYTDYSLFGTSNPVSIDNTSSTINTNINQSTSAINEVNSSLTDSSISEYDSDYVLPESGVNDIAESGFANIFDKLRIAFTQESSGQGLVVQVPFTDKSFTISRSSVFGAADLGIVGTLINSFWYFLVSLWIVKDIAHKMNMIKSGNIELAQTSNIKEDLL